METTERIVEAYMRHVRGCATFPNIRYKKHGAQGEIDLVAINLLDGTRYHVETSIHITAPFAKLTDGVFDDLALKERLSAPKQRRTMGFFISHKFGPLAEEALQEYGFKDGNYQRVIVSIDWTPGAAAIAKEQGIELLKFGDVIHELRSHCLTSKGYQMDDALRTIHLVSLADSPAKTPKERKKILAGLEGPLPVE